MVQIAPLHSSRTVLKNFWFLPVFVDVFIVIRFIMISDELPMHETHLCHRMEA